MMSLKPGFVMDTLEISDEQLKYWRKTLDPNPSRPQFSYQMMMCYALLKELIVCLDIKPSRLLQTNIADLFAWFDEPRHPCERERTVILIDKQDRGMTFASRDNYSPLYLHRQTQWDLVFIQTLEEHLLIRIVEIGTDGERTCMSNPEGTCRSMLDMKRDIWRYKSRRRCH